MYMKKGFILIAVLFSFTAAHAQKLELGVHAGAGFNTVPQTGRDSVLPDNAGGQVSYAVSIKALTNVGAWQFGLGLDMQQISAEYAPTKYVFANPATTLYLIANYDVGYNFYAGIDAGLLFASSANYTSYSDNNKLVPDVVYLEPGKGFAAGGHFGYNYYLSNRLNFSAEAAIRYGSYNYEYTETDKSGKVTTGQDKYSFIYPSLVFGIRLKLFTDPFRQWMPYKRVR